MVCHVSCFCWFSCRDIGDILMLKFICLSCLSPVLRVHNLLLDLHTRVKQIPTLRGHPTRFQADVPVKKRVKQNDGVKDHIKITWKREKS